MSAAWSLAAVLSAASVSLSAGTQDQPVFRSGVDLVRVDVRVTDSSGRPIADLRPEEIEIKEDGRVRPVLLFQHVEAPHGTYADAAQRTIAAQVSTNQGSPRGHVYVLVFDESHIAAGREQRARRAAEHFLRTRVRPGDRVALYALPGPGPQIDFTGDVARVLKAMPSVRGTADASNPGATLGTTATMRTDEAYEILRRNVQTIDRLAGQAATNQLATDTRPIGSTRLNPRESMSEDRTSVMRTIVEDARAVVARTDGDSRRFLAALADLMRRLRQVDGRKSVILFSEGFHVDNITHELEDVAAAAAQSYSVIYAMDLNIRGVDPADDTPNGGQQVVAIRDRLQSLGSLTAETGGELVTDATGQIDRALARMAETTEDYYLIGFTPLDSDRRDARYRRIQVNVRRDGARASARSGYAHGGSATPLDRRRAIDAAMAAPFSQQGLKIEYTTYVLRGSAPDVQRVILSLAAELPVAGASTANADVVYLVRDVATGKVVASGADTLPLPDVRGSENTTVGTGLYRVQFELPAGTYLMRAVVREPGGLLGSADRRFQVRALNGPDVTSSDLIIGSTDAAGLPVRATVYQTDILDAVVELYGRNGSQLDAVNVTAELASIGGSEAIRSVKADLQAVSATSMGASRGARIELPIAGVEPGDYILRAIIRERGETVGELLRDVTVRSGTRPAAPVLSVAAQFDPENVLRGDVARQFRERLQARAKPASEQALRGLDAFARRDYARALSALSSVQSAEAPDRAAIAFISGWAHAAAGNDPAAITAWRNAIVADPSLVPAYLALIDTYVRLGHPELAGQATKAGLAALPNSPELLALRARQEK